MPDEAPDDGAAERHVEIEAIEPLSLEEALSIVGEATRAGILVALGEARSIAPGASNALGYADLMERAGVEDSGRFNYHLERLVGPFVRREEAGYSLRLPGKLLYEAIVAGTLTSRRTVEPFPVGDCPACGDELTAAYHPDHLLTVECGGCATLFDAAHLPARGLEDRSHGELLDAAYARRHHEVATMRRGVCQRCGAVVERDLRPAASITYGSAPVEELAGLETYATMACTACNASLVGHPANVAVTAPAVVGFFADHGRDVARARWWDDPIAAARDAIEVIEEGPTAVAMPFELDGEACRVVLDDDLQVAAAERTAG